MGRIRLLLVVFFLICTGKISAQNKALSRAEHLSKTMSYASAIDAFEAILKKPEKLTAAEAIRARLGLAKTYFAVRDYNNADRVYSVVLDGTPVLSGDDLEAYKRYAQVLSNLGRYSESKFFWEKYSEYSDADKRGEQFAKLYSRITPLLRNQASYEVSYLGLNTGYPEFSPAYYNQGLVFVSGKSQSKAIKRVFNWDNSNFLDLYYLEDKTLLDKTNSTTASLGFGGANSSSGSRSEGNVSNESSSSSNDSRKIGKGSTSYVSEKEIYVENAVVPTTLFSKKINSKYQEGPSVFYDNDTRIIFTRNVSSGGGILGKADDAARLKLFSAERKGKDWSNVKELPFNSSKYSCGHPAITADGKVLFFISNMPGGFGGTDIYYSVFENGDWGTPVNVGSKINTAGDEMFPFIDGNGNLYFSSDGLPGLGLLDIFMVKYDIENKQPVSVVRNLGAPINSQFDDFGIITDTDRLKGYFSSNRKRGGNDDDLYRFTRIGSLYGCRDLLVNVKDVTTNKPITNFKFLFGEENGEQQNATTNTLGVVPLCLDADKDFFFEFESVNYKLQKVKFSNLNSSDFEPDTLTVLLDPAVIVVPEVATALKENKRLVQKWTNQRENSFRAVITDAYANPIQGAKVRFIDMCTGKVQEMHSRKDGTVEFLRNAECDYELVSTYEGYSLSKDLIEKTIRKNFFGRKVEKPSSITLFNSKLYKVGDVIRLENIYYASDEYKLNAAAKRELERLVDILKKHPNMAIEVTSHTDTRGAANVNQQLSDRRAKEVYDFLRKHVDEGRLKVLGKGETEPVNNCGEGVQCTDAEHARNRRTEFRILRMDKI